jgi:CheY-like chemotaxis protein
MLFRRCRGSTLGNMALKSGVDGVEETATTLRTGHFHHKTHRPARPVPCHSMLSPSSSAPAPNVSCLAAMPSPRVLLVDDNAINQLVACEMLVSLGAEVACTADGAEALDALESGRYDLVIMDVQMPVLNGLDATREWRRREAERALGHVPIVALTANAMPADRDRCLDAGMDDYLAKPVRRDQLAGMLKRWAGGAA